MHQHPPSHVENLANMLRSVALTSTEHDAHALEEPPRHFVGRRGIVCLQVLGSWNPRHVLSLQVQVQVQVQVR